MRYANVPVLLHADLLWISPNRKKRRKIFPPNLIFSIHYQFTRAEIRKYTFGILVVYSEKIESDGSHKAKISFPDGTEEFIDEITRMGAKNEIILQVGHYVLGVCRNLEFVDTNKKEIMGDPF